MEEEWKVVFERCEISNLGNCRRKFENGEYKNVSGTTNGGYKRIQIMIDGKIIEKKIHTLVALAFIGERPEGLVITHIDKNKLNNNVLNLRYVRRGENSINTEIPIDTEIPMDTKDRRRKVQKLYREKNKEKIALKRKENREKKKINYENMLSMLYPH